MKGCCWLLVLLTAGMGLACSGTDSSVLNDSGASISATPEPPSVLSPDTPASSTVELPAPELKGRMSVEEALSRRRSVREYAAGPLQLAEVSQLLWAAQGVTAEWGGRAAPSAGGLYPLEVLLVAGEVAGLAPGVYRYTPAAHNLALIREGDLRASLAAAALDQQWVSQASTNIVITAIYARTTGKYGDRGVRYVDMEAGHAAQNICLEATALGLGTGTIGAFHDDRVKELLDLAADEIPLYILPVGRLPD